MALTKSIQVLIKTADIENAGTNGKVFFGVAGREYHLDNDPFDNFERNNLDRFTVGKDSNLKWINHQITTEGYANMETMPIYIRLEPLAEGSDWAVSFVAVRQVGPGGKSWGHDLRDTESDIKFTWLGKEHGQFIYLVRHNKYGAFFTNPTLIPTNV